MGRALLILCLGSFIILGMVQRAVHDRQITVTEGNVETFQVSHARNAVGTGLELGLNRVLHVENWESTYPLPWVFTVDEMDIEVQVDTHGDYPGEVPQNFLRVRSEYRIAGRDLESFAFIEDGVIIPPIDGALGFYGEGSEVYLDGNAEIIGHDTNPDGTAGPSPSVPGIASIDEESNLINHKGNATYEGEPDFLQKDMDSQELSEHLEMYKQQGTLFESQTDLGTVEEPAITIFEGYNKLSDDVNAAGIMIISKDAQVDLRGNFGFQGLVIVEGELDIRGNVSIHGALMFSDNALLEIDDPDSGDGTFTGNASIRYSSQALQNINSHLSGEFEETKKIVDRVFH